MKTDHIRSELCDGMLESCSDPEHLPYDEMISEIDRIQCNRKMQQLDANIYRCEYCKIRRNIVKPEKEKEILRKYW